MDGPLDRLVDGWVDHCIIRRWDGRMSLLIGKTVDWRGDAQVSRWSS